MVTLLTLSVLVFFFFFPLSLLLDKIINTLSKLLLDLKLVAKSEKKTNKKNLKHSFIIEEGFLSFCFLIFLRNRFTFFIVFCTFIVFFFLSYLLVLPARSLASSPSFFFILFGFCALQKTSFISLFDYSTRLYLFKNS